MWAASHKNERIMGLPIRGEIRYLTIWPPCHKLIMQDPLEYRRSEPIVITLWIITAAALLGSLVADRTKTRLALVKGLKMFLSIMPVLLGILALVSLFMAAVTPETIERVLSGTGPVPFFTAIGTGSIALMPGFIAYPLAGVLRQQGASISVISAFITSLMMVGVFTLPIEARFFGWKISLLRNGLALIGTIVVAACMSVVLA